MSVTLIDAGPLIALANEREGHAHRECARLFQALDGGLATTLPVLTEAMYFVGRAGGWYLQERIWKLIAAGSVSIFHLAEEDIYRMSLLMEEYLDTPMDFADSSLVAAAEKLNTNRIFTLDSDFSVYRVHSRQSFQIIP